MANPLPPRASSEITVMNLSENSAVFTINATSDIITSAAHGLVAGDCVTVAAATTLPTGLSASTYYYVITVTTDTFQLSTTPGGTAVDVSNTGTGALTWYQERCTDSFDASPYRHVSFSIDVDSSPSVTLKCVSSIADSIPTFLNPQSDTNSYDFQDATDKEDQQQIEGDDGLAIAAEDHRQIVVNADALGFIAFKTLDFKSGDIVIKVKGFRN